MLGANPVADKGTNKCTGKVEEVDDSVPAKDSRKRGLVIVDSSQD